MTGKDFEQQGHRVVLVQSRPLSGAASMVNCEAI